MTAYRNITNDFPRRCMDVLDALRPELHEMRGVTALLMVAMSGFVVPFERLRISSEGQGHPFGDHLRFPDAAEALSELMQQKFVGSRLCQSSIHTWCLVKKYPKPAKDLDEWIPVAGLKPISANSVSFVLKLLRNALAHGNIHTKNDPISDLVFVQEHYSGQDDERTKPSTYDVLTVSVADFERFVRAWVQFTRDHNVWDLRLAA